MAETPPEKAEPAEKAPGDTAKKPATMAARRTSGPLVVGLLAVVVIGVLLYALGTTYFAGSNGGGTRSYGQAAIGGPFTLIDHTGKPVTEATFKGRFMLITFGYTFCPDVCPTTLTDMADAINELGKDGDRVVPILITVDPARDTAENLKEYVSFFHPRTVGLTGTAEAIKSAAKAYKVYYAKAKQEKGADPNDYLMDHSAIIYLMGPDGRFRTHFSHGTRGEVMAKRIREFL